MANKVASDKLQEYPLYVIDITDGIEVGGGECRIDEWLRHEKASLKNGVKVVRYWWWRNELDVKWWKGGNGGK